jgi:hypothetical protein
MKPLAMTSGTLYHLIRETHIGILAYYDLVLIRDDYFVTIRLIPFLQHVENRDMLGEGTQFRYKSLTLGEYQFGLRFRGNDQEYQGLVDLYNRDTAAELPDTGLNKNLINDVLDAARDYDDSHKGKRPVMLASVLLVIPLQQEPVPGYMDDAVSALLTERLERDGTILDWGYTEYNRYAGLLDTGTYQEGDFLRLLQLAAKPDFSFLREEELTPDEVLLTVSEADKIADAYTRGAEAAFREVADHIELGTDYTMPVPDNLRKLYDRLQACDSDIAMKAVQTYLTPKYEVGFHVWFMKDNRVYSGLVSFVDVQLHYSDRPLEHRITYTVQPAELAAPLLLGEADLFPTKRALIDTL